MSSADSHVQGRTLHRTFRSYYRSVLHHTGHFRNEHFACDHPHCLEARFVVFANEQELKQHRLREHNEQLSRNERRAALQIPVNLTVWVDAFI
jgi:hypothetical protein